MKQVTPFVISEFTNPSGKIVFQLYARIDGQRFRKNFPTRTEAEAERQVQEVGWLQRDTGTRAAVTRLTEDQLHEAESAFRRIAGLPRPLSFYLDFALTNYKEPEKQKPLAEAAAECIAAKEHEFAQDQLAAQRRTATSGMSPSRAGGSGPLFSRTTKPTYAPASSKAGTVGSLWK